MESATSIRERVGRCGRIGVSIIKKDFDCRTISIAVDTITRESFEIHRIWIILLVSINIPIDSTGRALLPETQAIIAPNYQFALKSNECGLSSTFVEIENNRNAPDGRSQHF